MKLFKLENFKFKFLNVTLVKFGQKKCRMFFFLFGIPVFEFKTPILKLYKQIKENTNFDMRHFDEKISEYIKVPNNIYDDFSENKIVYLASELYDVGGHTKCIETLAESLKVDYEQCLFLTKKFSSYENAPITMKKLENSIKIDGIDKNLLFFEKQVDELYNKIVSFGAKILFVYIHPDDIVGAAILSLIRRTTNIKIIFFNHASHYPNLGMTFADLILEGMPTTLKITNEKRHLYNARIIGLQSKAKEETVYYSKEELFEVRKNLGITNDELMTISGGASYKFFENDTSEYFEMIKQILINKKVLKHVIITNLKKNQKDIINKIFDNSELKERLIILPLSPDYEKFFQAADLYIDSFPVSSALTQIDLMRLKVPTVVKINTKTPEFSFHEYMPEDYPYMSENVENFKKHVLYLLDNKEKREEIVKSNYVFWLETYEKNVVKNKYIHYMNNLSNKIELINFKEIPYSLQMETRNWRNSENVAKYFKIPYIDEKTHKNWLSKLKIENPTTIAFLIKEKNTPIGVTYFHSIDYENKTCDWGIYIYNSDFRGKGIGDKTLKECINIAQILGMKEMYLDVLSTNEKAINLYKNNGFKQCTSTDEKFSRLKREVN